MQTNIVSWSEVPETTAPGGVVKQTLALEGVTLVTVKVPAGAVAPRHSHAHEQFVQVISGAGALTTEQGEAEFGPGSVFVLPSGTWHSARFDSDTVLVETNLSASYRR